jgi:AraC-like DNA-binding protein
MPQVSDLIRISAPFGTNFETVQSSRYQYRNDERGREQFVILQWTFGGFGQMSFGTETYDVPPEHAFIVIVPENSAYFYPPEAREPWHFGWLNLYGDLAIHLCKQLRKVFGPVMPLRFHGTAGKMLTRLIRQADERSPTDPYALSAECYGFLMEWAREIEAPSQRRDPIRTAIQICQTRFRESLGVKELAAEAGLTREHFTRLFAQETQTSPARFLRQLRVDAAHQLIGQHSISLKEVALRCGFPSSKAMNRALAEVAPTRKKSKKPAELF